MKKTKETAVSKPILTQLREMKVGDILVFPGERASSVRATCSMFGFEWNKTFRTSVNREERTISVTREA